jgi:hypothetical protein
MKDWFIDIVDGISLAIFLAALYFFLHAFA